MKSKGRAVRIAVDAAMTALLPVLMAYSLVGEALHEIAGVAMLLLFVAHHTLNRKATLAMFRGKQTPERVFGTAVNLMLFAVMILLPISGIMMSKHLFTFLPTTGLSATARTVHLLASCWGFVLMSLHLGQHTDRITGKLKKHKIGWIAFSAAFFAIAAYGVYAFIKRQIAEYLFLRTSFVFFDFDEPRVFFFLDYLAVIILFAWIGYILKLLLRCLHRKREQKSV